MDRAALRGADFRGGDFRGGDFRGAVLRGAEIPDAVTSASSSPDLANCRNTKAVPPTPTSTGHSTSPAAPIAPIVSNAAGVEWLPELSPLRIPAALPCKPPTMPLTAAPPTAPAAAVVAFAVSVTMRVTPRTMSISIPALLLVSNSTEYPLSQVLCSPPGA